MSTKPETTHKAGPVSECSLASGDLFGRRVLTVGFRSVLQCRCDAATLTIPLPAPVRGSLCQLCNLTKYQPPAGLPKARAKGPGLLILAMRYADPNSEESKQRDRENRLPSWIKDVRNRARPNTVHEPTARTANENPNL